MKGLHVLNLTTVLIVFVVVYIVLLKLMWDWQERVGAKETSSYQFLVVVATTALLGLLIFIGYVVLSSHTDTDKLTLLILWALAIQVLIAAYTAYFSRDLNIESGYLLMILITLHAVFAVKLQRSNLYASLAAFAGGLLSVFLYARTVSR